MALNPIPDDQERVVIIRRWLEAALILLPEPRLGIALHTRGKREAFKEALAFVNGLGAASETCHCGSTMVAHEPGWLKCPDCRATRKVADCTGVAASWCPIHGDCSCPRLPSGEREDEHDSCPLHGSTSNHAMERS